jgi:hypothetical protein
MASSSKGRLRHEMLNDFGKWI